MQCLGCYKTISKDEAYCAACRKKLRLGTTFRGILGFRSDEFREIQKNTADRLSVSGYQDKISLRFEKGSLVVAETNGEYILKPSPASDLRRTADIPANEHLTMHLASVSGIHCAPHALVRFRDGPLAYITLRFDRKSLRKLHQEDFAQLAERTEETHGKSYKYDFSYEEMLPLVEKYTSAPAVEKERFYRQLLFNYITGNGDAHLKNFSVITDEEGITRLSPAYDLLNTALHIKHESRTALDLFKDYESENFRINGFYTGQDFLEFAERAGIRKIRRERFLKDLLTTASEIFINKINHSFLSEEAKEIYTSTVLDRSRALGI